MSMIPVLIDRRWSVLIPEHRAIRPGWDWWEWRRLSYMHAVIRPGDVVWEVGAEQGDLSVLYATWGARLVLIEPDEGFWPALRHIFVENGMGEHVVGTYHGFIGPTGTDTPLIDFDWPVVSAAPLRQEDRAPLYYDKDSESRQVTTLNALLDVGLPTPDVVSMDVDGAEYQALLGADRLLSEARPIMFLSVHPWHLNAQYGDTADDVLHHMELHGYQGECLAYDHEVHWLFKPVNR